MMKQVGTMIQLVGKPPNESGFFFMIFFPLNLALKGELRSAYLFKMKSWIEVFGQEESWIWLLGELCR